MNRDIEEELRRILDKRNKEIELQTNSLLEQGKNEYLARLKCDEKSKDDFLAIHKKKVINKKSNRLKNMKKLIVIILIGLVLGFVYYKFIRNDVTKKIEYSITTTSISKIITNPRNYENSEVSVHGKVVSSFSLGIKYYVLDDGTGRIYVITKKAVPQTGEMLRVMGIFNQRLKIGSLQVETITEK
jgi:uncharacterized protein YdeI (BOF family)